MIKANSPFGMMILDNYERKQKEEKALDIIERISARNGGSISLTEENELKAAAAYLNKNCGYNIKLTNRKEG